MCRTFWIIANTEATRAIVQYCSHSCKCGFYHVEVSCASVQTTLSHHHLAYTVAHIGCGYHKQLVVLNTDKFLDQQFALRTFASGWSASSSSESSRHSFLCLFQSAFWCSREQYRASLHFPQSKSLRPPGAYGARHFSYSHKNWLMESPGFTTIICMEKCLRNNCP